MPHVRLRLCAVLLPACIGTANACADTTGIAAGALQYEGAVEIVSDGELRTDLFLTNTSRESIRLTFGCPNGTAGSALRVQDMSGPRWQSRTPRPGTTCTFELHVFDLEPGESGQVTRAVSMRDILGDSLSSAVYQLTLVPDFDQNVPLVEIDLGEMMLDR